MLTRILALVAVLLLAPSTLAPAHAHALSLESASLGIFARNVDILKEIPDLSHYCIKEKSTEQSESSNRREEYLRARYMVPSQGRFFGMDPFVGFSEQPFSLNRFLYVLGNPVNLTDPSGLYTPYTPKFGHLVEREVCNQYHSAFPSPRRQLSCGRVTYYSPAEYFKPDIFDWTRMVFAEVKPFSPSGIPKGALQISFYIGAYTGWPFYFRPEILWVPADTIVDGDFTYFMNFGGVIFYTTEPGLREKVGAATLATAAFLFSIHTRQVATRLGGVAGARALANNSIRAVTARASTLIAQLELAAVRRF